MLDVIERTASRPKVRTSTLDRFLTRTLGLENEVWPALRTLWGLNTVSGKHKRI